MRRGSTSSLSRVLLLSICLPVLPRLPPYAAARQFIRQCRVSALSVLGVARRHVSVPSVWQTMD
eukprot:1008989-Alexandrium_andersonii.AAC.1